MIVFLLTKWTAGTRSGSCSGTGIEALTLALAVILAKALCQVVRCQKLYFIASNSIFHSMNIFHVMLLSSGWLKYHPNTGANLQSYTKVEQDTVEFSCWYRYIYGLNPELFSHTSICNNVIHKRKNGNEKSNANYIFRRSL